MINQVNIYDIVNMTDIELLKTVLSSADFFPGLYRISASWDQAQDDKFLKLIGLVGAAALSETGKTWTRQQWLSQHDHIFQLAYGKGSRNDQRAEDDIKILLKNCAKRWYTTPTSFSLAVIDPITRPESIIVDHSYYMMGSILRFEQHQTKISYNHFSGDCYACIDIPFNEVQEYINSIFSPAAISDLFLPAEIVAILEFDDEVGKLTTDNDKLNAALSTFPVNCPIFGAVNYPITLPIRFAKPIGITNVCSLP